MKGSLLWASLALAEICLAEPFALQTHKNKKRHGAALRKRSLEKRQKPFPVTLGSVTAIGGGFYYVNASIGSPAQEVSLDIDTGSSDVWMFGPQSCDSQTSLCLGGAFDPDQSSTAGNFTDGFQIQYFTQGSGVSGEFFTDDFTIGGQTVSQLIMGLATQAESVQTGIMGIGFDLNEASASSDSGPYPNLIDTLKDQGIIGAKAYSLYLDDIQADTGTIIFGGYDTEKFQGDLSVLEIQPSTQSGVYSDFAVIAHSVGVTDSSGSTVLTTQNFPNSIILDSGTALTTLPSDVFKELVNYFGAVSDQTYDFIVPCDFNGKTGSLDYQFGNADGPVISVPFNELAVPLYDLSTGDVITDTKGNPVCRFGLQEPSSDDEPLLFGDTFLRSAYVVYDLDNLQIGLAQTVFNSTNSNVKAITANSKSENLPGSLVDAGTTIQQTATAGVAGGAETASAVSGNSQATAAVGTGAGTGALQGVQTTYTNRATDIPGSTPSSGSSGKTSKGAAASFRASQAGSWVGIVAQAGGLMAAVSVGAMLML